MAEARHAPHTGGQVRRTAVSERLRGSMALPRETAVWARPKPREVSPQPANHPVRPKPKHRWPSLCHLVTDTHPDLPTPCPAGRT